MDFLMNTEELVALCGLPHIQQLAYVRGIRPYMDVKTGIVGMKRKISHQSIAEQLYIEPHQGIKSQSWSRDQVRRALSGLARAGVVNMQSEGLQLILKCPLATLGYFIQNKAAIKPPEEAALVLSNEYQVNKGLSGYNHSKANIDESQKAATPLKEDNYYIYLLSQFEKFWDLYPLKKSQQKAWQQFQALTPDEVLCCKIINALQEQIAFEKKLKSQGLWIASWKYPANWLAQHCWNDELIMEALKERTHAKHQTDFSKPQPCDSLWDSCKSGLEPEEDNNVIKLTAYRNKSQAY